MGKSVSVIEDFAFDYCGNLTAVFFKGNSPRVGFQAFAADHKATIYYLPGTTGWGPTLDGRPTALWYRPHPVILSFGPSFGLQTNRFGFIISWATNTSVVVEACRNLRTAAWAPVATNTLTDGWSYFSDPHWTDYPRRFYRLRSL